MFNQGAVPAHLTGFLDQLGSNIPDKASVPSLSYEGKTWTISADGKKTKLMGKNSDGDEVPLSVMRVVVLGCAPRRGRQFYEGTYDPNKIAQPKCWSSDGVTPHKAVDGPQASACDKCPRSVKGSKVLDNGNTTTECSQFRMLAVVPTAQLGKIPPLRLKIAITSDWDSQSPDQEAQGWYSFSRYLDFLKSMGVQHTAGLVTKIKFDPNTAYPKLFFQNERWITPEEQDAILPMVNDPGTAKLLDGSWTPAGVDGKATEGEGWGGDVKASPKVEPEVAAKQAEPEPEEEQIPGGVTQDQDEEVVVIMADEPSPEAEAAKPAKPAVKKAEVSEDVSDELASLLSDWTK